MPTPFCLQGMVRPGARTLLPLLLGAWLVSVTACGEAGAQEPITLQPRNGGGVVAVAFAPDGKTLASWDASGDEKVWDVASGKRRWQHEGSYVEGSTFCPVNGKGVLTRDMHYWDVTTGTERLSFPD